MNNEFDFHSLIRLDNHPEILYFCVDEIKRKWNLPSFQMWVSQTFGEKIASAIRDKQDHYASFLVS